MGRGLGQGSTLADALLESAIPGLVVGLVFGAALAANRGGWYLFMQRRLRRQAHEMELLPQDTMAFLQSAVDARILRATGGAVQFRHRTLADHLAPKAPAPASPTCAQP